GAMAVQKELMGIPDFSGSEEEGILSKEITAVKNAKKAILMVAGAGVQKLMQKLKDEQEILMNLSDMMIELFTMESTLLRTLKLISLRGEAACSLHVDMTKVFISDAMERLNGHGKHALQSFSEGDELRMMLMGLKRFTKFEPINTKDARRRVAAKLIEENKYCFSK
ncbi:MAG: acyl-CoA dehydrogenase, partial [Chitinophagales bacterium]|nr:acyl-CoA dehydrogenase [Chitinophagales bacterium]